jgi:D-alanyl-D-alanine carboxypeptidase/D-alanyl-D-alanine-endopeptidase (penicillin-binding protein 4)
MKNRFFIACYFCRWLLLISSVAVLPAAALAQAASPARSLAELRAQLDARLNQPRFSGALWGVKIASLDSGKVLYEYHADRLMSPASNSKLYTGALALNTLGGDYQFSTPVYATTRPNRFGTVHGDLIVSGRGDPSWKNTNFWEVFTPFVSVLTNAGVRRITGDLVADTTFFHGPPVGSSWSVEDLEDTEGAEVSALTLEDNLAQISARPGPDISSPCSLTFLTPDTQLVLVNRTQTIPRGGSPRLETRRAPGSKTLFIFGELPLDDQGEILETPVPEPSAWFGAALKEVLAQHGVVVKGKVRCLAWPELPPWSETNLVKLGEVKSPPLREVIQGFMKPSQNLETDLVFDHVGETLRPKDASVWKTSEQAAVAALEKFLATNQIPADVHFDEGSGLSRNNLTSANATVALLQMMAANQWAQAFTNALPIAGVDGTLRRRMRNPPAAGNVHAKTGTLRWVNALSGYVTTAAGERLVFSLMLNRYDSPPNRKRTDELDEIAAMLAGFKGRSDE